MSNEEIQRIYDYSKSKSEIVQKLNIRTNQNGINIDKDILEYFSQIGIATREQISKKNLSNHWLEIQKRDYELNPKYCLWCGKKLPFEKRFSKCCNQSCAISLGNKKKGSRSEETKQKISKTIKKSFLSNKQYISSKNKKIIKHINELINEGIILNLDNYIPKDKYVNINKLHIHNCLNCGRAFYGRISKYGNFINAKECCYKCKLEYNSKQASERRKEEIESGTFQGWKSRNITSYAEKFWKQVLDNNNIKYIREYVFEYGNKGNGERYFLDFYIEINNRKIDLEIDGKQHLYEDRKQSDQIRDEYIKSKGIEVYRISWNEINTENGKQLMKEKIDNFINYLK